MKYLLANLDGVFEFDMPDDMHWHIRVRSHGFNVVTNDVTQFVTDHGKLETFDVLTILGTNESEIDAFMKWAEKRGETLYTVSHIRDDNHDFRTFFMPEHYPNNHDIKDSFKRVG